MQAELTELLKAYRHQVEVPVRYSDIDMLQHVNNARYLSFLEEARIAYCYDVLDWDGSWDKLNMILARAEVDFIQPIFLTDKLTVYTRCTRLGAKSFDFEYLMVKEATDSAGKRPASLAARARTVMVAYDTARQTSMLIPDEMGGKIRAYEPGMGQVA